MVVCLNQSACFLEETINSIKYAEKAMRIRPPPAEAKVPLARDADEFQLRKRIMQLEGEVSLLRARDISTFASVNVPDQKLSHLQLGSQTKADEEKPTVTDCEAEDYGHLLANTPSFDDVMIDYTIEQVSFKPNDGWMRELLSTMLQKSFEFGRKSGRQETGLDYLDQVLATGEKAIAECQAQIEKEPDQDRILELYRSLKNVADKVEQDLNRRTEIVQEISQCKQSVRLLADEAVEKLCKSLSQDLQVTHNQSIATVQKLKQILSHREHQIIELSKAFKHMFARPGKNKLVSTDCQTSDQAVKAKPRSTGNDLEVSSRIKPDFGETTNAQQHRVSEVIRTLAQALRPVAQGSLGLGQHTTDPGLGLGSLGSHSDVCSHQSPASTPRSTHLEGEKLSPRRLDSTQRKNPPSTGSPRGTTDKKRQGILRQSKSSADLGENVFPKVPLNTFQFNNQLDKNMLNIQEYGTVAANLNKEFATKFVNPHLMPRPVAVPSLPSRHPSITSAGPTRRFSNNRNNMLDQSYTNPMSLVSGGGFTDRHS